MNTTNRYSHLLEQIKLFKPKTILEIGTWNGLQAKRMVGEASKFNKDVKYIGFDLFEGMTPEIKEKEIHAKKNVAQKEAEKNLKGIDYTLVVGNTHQTLPEFVETNKNDIDFIFIDGGHSLETIESDWNNIKNLLHQNTCVIFDDYYQEDDAKGCKLVIDKIQNENKYTVEMLPTVDIHNNGSLKIQLVKVLLC